MENTETRYLYFVNKSGGEDYITTSFTFENNVFIIYNFNSEIKKDDIELVAMDYTFDPFVLLNNSYTNSNGIEFFEVRVVDYDEDRNYLKLEVSFKIQRFDLKQVKRDIKIDSLLN
jgi:hypothetical protein